MMAKEGDVTDVFGLTREQLRPIVENVAGERVCSFDIAIEYTVEGHYGYQADKVIPTFAYMNASGRSAKATVFAKRFHEPGPREAHHYTHLAQHDAPVARMYGALTGQDGRETIFIEFLGGAGGLLPFDRFLDDTDSFVPFLELAARFNAIQPSQEYRPLLYIQTADDLHRRFANAAEALERIWECAEQGDLGGDLSDLCAEARGHLPRLQRLAADLVAPVSQMEVGLVHGDFYPDQALRREGTGEFVLVDLEFVGLRARFTDVGRWIGASDEVRQRCLPQAELAEHYLDAYRRSGGSVVALDDFLEETRLLALADALMMLPFGFARSLDGDVDWTEDRDEGRRVFRADVHTQLRLLLDGIA
ncbi:MAG: phosphotransferase [Armatimonadota bacterium]|nr:phosphotransferase [Armatimonadota bacterium]